MQPNIILIVCDQMRGDCLGSVNHPDVKTPYLDTIAAEGNIFTNAYSATPSCVPARASLLTGQSQDLHGRVGYKDGVDWEYNDMFPEVFSNNGYETSSIGKMHVHPPLNKCGFQQLDLHDGYIGYYRKDDIPYYQHQLVHDEYVYDLKNKYGMDADVATHGIECNSFVTRPWNYDENYHPTNWVVNKSIRFLNKRNREKPFLLKASFVRPHPPFDAPQIYFNMYKDKELSPPTMGDWAKNFVPKDIPFSFSSMFGTKDSVLQQEAMIGYYACITHMDHQIGRLYKALDESNLLENSIIIFTSDHGELLFDHGFFRKVLPYQGSINIPFIVRVGKNIVETKPSINKNIVELRDIAPTILDFANIVIPDKMNGISLKKVILYDADTRDYLHGEHSWNEFSNHYIVTRTEKYIWYSQTGKEQFFDLVNDPKEENDLINYSSHKNSVDRLRGKLIEELKNREEGYSDGVSLIVGKKPKDILTKVKGDKNI